MCVFWTDVDGNEIDLTSFSVDVIKKKKGVNFPLSTHEGV